NEIAGIGVQVHGGMGFIEETGAAQYVRDVRITTIYEGTTGIQSNDLIGRKLGRDGGAGIRAAALDGVRLLRDATAALLAALGTRPDAGMAVSVPYLKLCGYVIGG